MNNSKLAIDSVPLILEKPNDNTVSLRQREEQLVKILTAIQSVYVSEAWSSLKTELFDSIVDRLEQSLKSEARRIPTDTHKLASLSGELKWAERYSDLTKLEQDYRKELTNVKSLLYGKTEETG